MDDGTPTGWYLDPSERHELRFWDGQRWSEHVVDDGVPMLDHPTRSGRLTTRTHTTHAPDSAGAGEAMGEDQFLDLTRAEDPEPLVSATTTMNAGGGAGTAPRSHRGRRLEPPPAAVAATDATLGGGVPVRLTRSPSPSPEAGAPRARRGTWLWVALALVLAFAAGFAAAPRGTDAAQTPTSPSTSTAQLSGRPPAAPPAGARLVRGPGVSIAAPTGWRSVEDPAAGFEPLNPRSWTSPIAIADPDATEGILVARLVKLDHHPQIDPAQFWSDQVSDTRDDVVVSAPVAIAVQGYRANQVRVLTSDGAQVVTAIDTGTATYLVAVRAGEQGAAVDRSEQVMPTFNPS